LQHFLLVYYIAIVLDYAFEFVFYLDFVIRVVFMRIFEMFHFFTGLLLHNHHVVHLLLFMPQSLGGLGMQLLVVGQLVTERMELFN